MKDLRIHRIWWQLSVFIIVSILAVYGGMEFDRELSNYLPEGASMPSVFNRKPSGYSGLSELAAATGLHPHAWQSPYRELSSVHGTLIIVSPSQSLQPYELEQILTWVEAGNNLIYLDEMLFESGQSLADKLNIKVRLELPVTDQILPVAGNQPLLAHVPKLLLTADSRLSGGDSVISDKNGSFLTLVPRGKGRILLAVTPSLCANRRLTDRAAWPNFQLLINCLATMGGEVWFDELCHGYSKGTNVFTFLLRGPVGLICLQMLVALLLAIASSAQRFGPPAVLSNRREISNLEYIKGLANTYQRAQASDLALEVLDRAFRSQLSRYLGVSAQTPDQQLAESWAAATGQAADDLLSYFAACRQALSGNKPSREQLVELVSACDKISERSKDLLKGRRAKSG